MSKKRYVAPEIVRGLGLPMEGPVINLADAEKSGGGYEKVVRLTTDSTVKYYMGDIGKGIEAAYRQFKQIEERRASYREAALSLLE